MSFPAYSCYKDSGVSWLGEVPSHWNIQQTKRKFRKRKDLNTGMVCEARLALTMNGVVPRSLNDLDGLQSNDFEGYQIFEPGDLAFKLIDLQNIKTSRVGMVPTRGIMSPAYIRLEPCTAEIGRFGFWYFMGLYWTQVFNNLGGGVRQTLGPEDLLTVAFPIPTIEEQRTISDFLDRETGKIDALVEEQKRLIDLLKEKRQAVISHAVTKGLNPDAPMKDTGLEWLGEVPAHWALGSVRHLLSRIEQGWSPECESRSAADEEWGVLKAGCVNGGIYREHENKALPLQLDPMPEYEVQPGDVLMSRANGSPDNVGAAAFITSTRPRVMLSDKIFRLRPSPAAFPAYLAILLGSRPLRYQIERSISGADGLANNLPQSSLKAFRCAVPPLAEQKSIVAIIEHETRKIDDAIATCVSSVSLLQERRAALISAAVTGKIDVRDFVVDDAQAPAAAPIRETVDA